MKMTVPQAVRKYKDLHKLASAVLSQSLPGLPDETAVLNLTGLMFVSDIDFAEPSGDPHAGADDGQEKFLRESYGDRS